MDNDINKVKVAVEKILLLDQLRSNGHYQPVHARVIVQRINRNLSANGLFRPMTERLLREAVAKLRTEGKPIVSGNFGYMISRNPEVIMECSKRLKKQAAENYRISKILHSLALQEKTLFHE